MSIPVAIIVQARMGGSRFPGKVLEPLLDQPMLLWQLDRLDHAQIPDIQIFVAAPQEAENQRLADVCARHGRVCLQPPCAENDVLGRYAAVAEAYAIDHIIRVTADCPLIDPMVILTLWQTYQGLGAQGYLGLADEWPDGQDCEVFSRAVLQWAQEEAHGRSDREHVTPWMKRGDDRFQTAFMGCPFDYHQVQYSVDTPEDLQIANGILDQCLAQYGPMFGWRDIATVIRNDTWLTEMIAKRAPRNHAYREQVWREKGGTTIHVG